MWEPLLNVEKWLSAPFSLQHIQEAKDVWKILSAIDGADPHFFAIHLSSRPRMNDIERLHAYLVMCHRWRQILHPVSK